MVTLALDLTDDTLSATMDLDKMNQVMLNLLLNALDAMPAGGPLTVRVRGEGGCRIQVQVIDSGVGIDPKDQPHIFEPLFFHQENRNRAGTCHCPQHR